MNPCIRLTTTSQGDVVVFHCPGCQAEHAFRVSGPAPAWCWNGSLESPTLSPRLLYQEVPGVRPRCHSFIHEGWIQFFGDCQHGLAGKRVRLPRAMRVVGWMTFPLQIAIGALIAFGTLWLVCYILQLQQQIHG
jgi:hypothetical protein